MPARSFVSFQLDNQLFGIDIVLVREINRHLEMTPVPHARDFIRGLVNLRGQIVTVLDLKKRLGLGHSEMTKISHNIILKTDLELAGFSDEDSAITTIADKASFWVDQIGDVITIDTDNIELPPANIGAIDGKYLSGVVKLENQLMGILSVGMVLNERTDGKS